MARKKEKLDKKQQTAQDFTNTAEIEDCFLYTRDGYIAAYIKILPISIALLSLREQKTLIKQITSELSTEKEPFHFLAVSRPVDITPLLDQYTEMRKNTDNPVQKDLLRNEIEEISRFSFSNEVVERQFYFYIYQKYTEDSEGELKKHISEFARHFEHAGMKTEILKQSDIIRLCNLVNNPAVITMEDEDIKPTIPILKEKEAQMNG